LNKIEAPKKHHLDLAVICSFYFDSTPCLACQKKVKEETGSDSRVVVVIEFLLANEEGQRKQTVMGMSLIHGSAHACQS
jgi:hypothetical protein